MPKQTRNTAPRDANVPHEPFLLAAASTAWSTGSMLPLSVSTRRNARTPVATALKKAQAPSPRLRTRPRGRPKKIVSPAMPPSTSTSPVDNFKLPQDQDLSLGGHDHLTRHLTPRQIIRAA